MSDRRLRLQEQLRIFHLFLTKIIRLLLNPRRLAKRLIVKAKNLLYPVKPAAISFAGDAASYRAASPVRSLSSLDIIVITFNSADTIEDCVRSIYTSNYHGPYRVHIWDNASIDGTRQKLQRLKAEFPGITIYESGLNLGFGRAINQVCMYADTAWMLLLNPDCMLHQNTISVLAAVAGPLWPTGVAAYEARQEPYEHPHFYDPVSLSTEWASAACLLINRQAFDRIGGFDENIFLYAEDVDLSWRLRLSGYSLRYVPDAVVTHYAFTEEQPFKPAQHVYGLINNYYLRLKYGKLVDVLAYYKALPRVLFYRPRYIPEILRGILQKSGKFIWNYKKLRIGNGRSVARFAGWDYEVRREGAYVESVPLEHSPLVSVIIRNHDRPDYLRDALQCLRNQTYKNIEVVVVEDRSENGKMLVGKFCDLNIKYFHNSLVRTRSYVANIGLGNASGVYIMFLDDDDLLFSDAVETLLSNLLKSNTLLAYTSSMMAYSRDRLSVAIEKGYSETFNRQELQYRNYLPVGSFMFHRKLYETAGGFDERLDILEDWHLIRRYARHTDFLFVPKTEMIFRVPYNKEIRQSRQKDLDEAYAYVKHLCEEEQA